MNYEQSNNTSVVFLNQPKLSTDKSDEIFNGKRIALIPEISKYITNNELFKGQEVKVFFIEKGVGSVVCILETTDQKYIFKTPLSDTHSWGEAQFLKVWGEAGVKVPNIFETGIIMGRPYILMEYVETPTLNNLGTSESLSDQGYYKEMGSVLHQMHTREASGFGLVKEGKAEYAEFNDWLLSDDVQSRTDYIKDNNILDEGGQKTIDDAISVLREFVSKNQRSAYCHDDFGTANIFATKPLTVFDPNPRFNHPYVDLGKTMCNCILGGTYPSELVDGYFGTEPYNEKALTAAIILNLAMKLRYAHQKNRQKVIENAVKFIESKDKIFLS